MRGSLCRDAPRAPGWPWPSSLAWGCTSTGGRTTSHIAAGCPGLEEYGTDLSVGRLILVIMVNCFVAMAMRALGNIIHEQTHLFFASGILCKTSGQRNGMCWTVCVWSYPLCWASLCTGLAWKALGKCWWLRMEHARVAAALLKHKALGICWDAEVLAYSWIWHFSVSSYDSLSSALWFALSICFEYSGFFWS